jgi:MFS family permease
MFMGAFLGSGLFGLLCDRWGRRRPLFLATSLIAVSMFASLAAPSFWVFAVLRAVTGLGAAGQSHCNFLLSTEPVGPSFRCASVRGFGACRLQGSMHAWVDASCSWKTQPAAVWREQPMRSH